MTLGAFDFGTQNFQSIGLWEHGTLGAWGFRSMGLLERIILGKCKFGSFELLDFLSITLWEYSL